MWKGVCVSVCFKNFRTTHRINSWIRCQSGFGFQFWVFCCCCLFYLLEKGLFIVWSCSGVFGVFFSFLFGICSSLWFQALVSSQFRFLFVQKGKVQSHSGSWGKSLLNTNPQVSVLSWPWESSSKLFYCKHHMCVLLDQVRRGQSSPEAWTADLDCFSAA